MQRKNHAEALAGKTAPGAPYHQAGIAQSVTGGTASQNTQMGQTVQSQSESHTNGMPDYSADQMYASAAENGTEYGVVRTQIEGRGWQGWCKIPYIQYDE